MIVLMKRNGFIIGLLSICAVIGGLYAYFEFDRVNEIKKVTRAYEVSAANSIKASIDLYYVVYGKYPYSKNQLLERLSTYNLDKKFGAKQFDVAALRKTMNSLRDFSYRARGDQQAYKFSYTDQNGEKKEIEGNYQEDYH